MGRFPLLVDMSDEKVLIFGGGSIGERKAQLFAQEGANVMIVGTEFTQGLKKMREKSSLNGEVELVKEKIVPNEIENLIEKAKLVVVATDDERLNDELTETAKKADVLVNEVDDQSTPVMIPSVIKQRNLIVSISTGGKSPAMCKFLRLKLEDWLKEDYSDMVEIQNETRRRLKEEVQDHEKRSEIIWSILKDSEVWDALQKDKEAGKKLVRERVKEEIKEIREDKN